MALSGNEARLIGDGASSRLRAEVMVAIIRKALAYAAAVQPDPAPEYWIEVKAKCEQIVAALKQGHGVKEARYGINGVARIVSDARVRAAARAAAAALNAADYASRGRAYDAAEAAVEAAGRASWALGTGPAPAEAAEAAAWQEIAGILLDVIDDPWVL